MLAHSIKPILELVPEAREFIKLASVDQDYPVNNRDSCIASAMALKYHECVDGRPVDIFAIEKVAKAIELYNVTEQVKDLNYKLIKSAHSKLVEDHRDHAGEYLTKEASFEGAQTGFVDITELAEKASDLYKEASAKKVEPSDSVKRYSGHGYLDKKAAVEALAARYQATSNVGFAKIASALGRMDTLTLKPETVYDVAYTVSCMDKEAGLCAKGFNFFNEAVMTKSAASAMQITLMNKPYAYEDVLRLGSSRISQYLGKDVADELDKGPANAKAVLETLPMDMQQILCSLLKNC